MKTIKLTNGGETKVCDCHYDKVMKYNWHWAHLNKDRIPKPYAKTVYRTHYKQNNVLLHRYILDAPKGKSVDHINGNTLDNRCSNLRLCTQSQNNANQIGAKKGSKSGVKGVYWHKGAKKWCAEVVHNKKKHYLGLFETLEEARKARNEKAQELHGDFYYPA